MEITEGMGDGAGISTGVMGVEEDMAVPGGAGVQ